MSGVTYQQRRGELETYFDRTAVQAWARLTSTAPVSGIRATVRAGRDRMRTTLLDWLPQDLCGARLLDAGCGTGALALEAARRGAHVVAIDLSPTLVNLARERAADETHSGTVDYRVGDMFDAGLGEFDHVVAMDSLIHYPAADIARVVGGFARRSGASVLFTFAPKTPMLAAMHAMGKFFPRADRAPAIEPVRQSHLHRLLSVEPGLAGWIPRRTERVDTGFYKSQAQELIRA